MPYSSPTSQETGGTVVNPSEQYPRYILTAEFSGEEGGLTVIVSASDNLLDSPSDDVVQGILDYLNNRSDTTNVSGEKKYYTVRTITAT